MQTTSPLQSMKNLSSLIAFFLAAVCLSACSNAGTEPISELERATADFDAVEDGRLWMSETDSNIAYVYDNGKWRLAYWDEITVGKGCTRLRDGATAKVGQSVSQCKWSYCIESYRFTDSMLDSISYVCNGFNNQPKWEPLLISQIPKNYFFNDSIEYGAVADERDGHHYLTVDLNGKTWMAENLSYDTKNPYYQNCSSLGCNYRWEEAMNFSKGDSVVNNRGICMEGWHIPDTTEWNELIEVYGVASLLSEIGWSFGDNATGLSLWPSKEDRAVNMRPQNTPASDYKYEMLVTSLYKDGYGYALIIAGNKVVWFDRMYEAKYVQNKDYSKGVVRCVKD